MESFCHYNTFILVCSVHATPTLCLTLNVWHEARLLFETTEWALKALRGTSDCLDARTLTSSGIRSVKWGLLWELKGKKKKKKKLRREKEREGERYHSGRCCALSLSHQQIHRFSYCEQLSSFRRRLSERCGDRGGLFVSGLTCCVCSCVCVGGDPCPQILQILWCWHFKCDACRTPCEHERRVSKDSGCQTLYRLWSAMWFVADTKCKQRRCSGCH